MRRMIIYHHYASLFINNNIVEVALSHNNFLVTHTMKQFSDNVSYHSSMKVSLLLVQISLIINHNIKLQRTSSINKRPIHYSRKWIA